MNKPRSFFSTFFWKILSILLTAFIILVFFYLYLESQLPDVSALKDLQLQVPLKIFSSDGKLLAEFGEVKRTPLTLKQIPQQLINAVLATEDQRFFEHAGVDFYGLLRATVQLALTGSKSQGGSTITMQVARNFYLSRKKTFARKINEILLAMKIDRELSKQKILELYLNKIYLGNRAYGVAAAAQIYYGLPLNKLSLPQLAMLAGLPKAPSTINPIVNPTAARERRNHVLLRMYELGHIDEKTYRNAITAPVTAAYHSSPAAVTAPYVAEMVRNLMVASFGEDAYTKDYRVFTTIDSTLQNNANQALRNSLLAYDQRHGYRSVKQNLGKFNPAKAGAWQIALENTPTINNLYPAAIISINDNNVSAMLANGHTITLEKNSVNWARRSKSGIKIGDVIRIQAIANGAWQLTQIPEAEGALVALDPNNGGIKALVGGFDYEISNFNRVTQAQRQPGSGFKPFIYAAALDKGYTLASIFNDAPIVFPGSGNQDLWRPQNDTRTFFGPIRLRFALAKSRNMVSIRLLQAITPQYAVDYITRFGFDPKRLPKELSLALGTAEVTPLELATAYAAFANGGYKISPYIIDHVTNAQGDIIYQAQPKGANETGDNAALRILSPQIAFLMTSALQDVIRIGTGQAASVLNRSDIAGKTGSTNDNYDAWFSGFNSDLVVTTWVGFDQPHSLYEYGSQVALPMWIQFMRTALQNKPLHTMAQPPDIISTRIDPDTGLLAQPDQANAVFEYFTTNTVPTEEASANAATADSDEPLF